MEGGESIGARGRAARSPKSIVEPTRARPDVADVTRRSLTVEPESRRHRRPSRRKGTCVLHALERASTVGRKVMEAAATLAAPDRPMAPLRARERPPSSLEEAPRLILDLQRRLNT